MAGFYSEVFNTFKQIEMDLKSLLSQPNAKIVDVREPWEYGAGHVEGSVNIPLGQIQQELETFKGMDRPLILICQSGNRSGMATQFLKAQGLEEVYNGGGWAAVNELKVSL